MISRLNHGLAVNNRKKFQKRLETEWVRVLV